MLSLVAVIVLLAGGGGYYYWAQYTGPAACARAFCAAMEKGDGKGMAALVTADSKSSAEMPTGTFSPPAGMNVRVEFQNVKRSGATAKARIRTSFKLGKGEDASEMSTTSPLLLVKESGAWRVDPMKTAELQMRSMGMADFDMGPGQMPSTPK